ncbi:MAG: hypothetical protein ABII00_09560 [Elusimicrobiota bacterium]
MIYKIIPTVVVVAALAGLALPYLLGRPSDQVHHWMIILLFPFFLYAIWKTWPRKGSEE